MNVRFFCALLLIFLVCPEIQADEENWKYSLTPYLWFAGLKGEVATVPPLPAAPIDISSSDALKDTEVSLMLTFEAKKNRQGLFLGLVYSDVQSDEELIPPPIDLLMQSTTKTTLFTAAYEYEVFGDGASHLDLMGGARYWSIDSKLEFAGGLGILEGVVLKHDESWVDPAIGIKGRTVFGANSRFYLAGGAALGGFGLGSDFFYDLNLNLGYQWSAALGTAVGYRYFDVDYENKEFLYDVSQQGWLLSLTWAF